MFKDVCIYHSDFSPIFFCIIVFLKSFSFTTTFLDKYKIENIKQKFESYQQQYSVNSSQQSHSVYIVSAGVETDNQLCVTRRPAQLAVVLIFSDRGPALWNIIDNRKTQFVF